MKRVVYRSLCAVLCVSMFSAAIPVRVIAEEERRQENTLEQVDTGAADNSGGSLKSDIDTSEIGNKSIKNDSDLANSISHQAELQVSLASDMSPDSEQATKAAVSGYQHATLHVLPVFKITTLYVMVRLMSGPQVCRTNSETP